MNELELLREENKKLKNDLKEFNDKLNEFNKEYLNVSNNNKELAKINAKHEEELKTLNNRITIYENILPSTVSEEKKVIVDKDVTTALNNMFKE